MTHIENNNRIIAEFMGGKIKNVFWGGVETLSFYMPYSHISEPISDFYNSLPYHSDWNLLIPVIEKISKIPLMNGSVPCTDTIDTCYPITFNMPDEEGNVMFRFKGGFLQKAPNLIEAAYNAVVEFIYYNQNS